jgi:hypothetical protein
VAKTPAANDEGPSHPIMTTSVVDIATVANWLNTKGQAKRKVALNSVPQGPWVSPGRSAVEQRDFANGVIIELFRPDRPINLENYLPFSITIALLTGTRHACCR